MHVSDDVTACSHVTNTCELYMATPNPDPRGVSSNAILQKIQHINNLQRAIFNACGPSNVVVPPTYSYRVKIINPAKKSEVIIRELHGFSSKFQSVPAI